VFLKIIDISDRKGESGPQGIISTRFIQKMIHERVIGEDYCNFVYFITLDARLLQT
jgi:hypothetical protein